MADSTLSRELSSLLECPICLNTIEKATALPCWHFFCLGCIRDLQTVIEDDLVGILCPICRAFAPRNSTRSVHFLQHILELIESSKQIVTCELCEPRKNARFRCQQCKQFFCSKHRDEHTQYKLFKNHMLIGIDGSSRIVDEHLFCAKHPDKTVELYCKDCKSLICFLCHATSHQLHQMQTVQEALNEIVPSVQKSLKAMQTALKKDRTALQTIEHEQKKLLTEYDNLEKEAEEHRNEAIRQINERAAEIKGELQTQKDKQEAEIKRNCDDLNGQIKYKENVVLLTEECLQNTTETSLLNTLISGLQDALNVKEPEYCIKTQYSLPVTFLKTLASYKEYFGEIVAADCNHEFTRDLDMASKQKSVRTSSFELNFIARSFAYYKDKIWVGDINNNSVHVFTSEGKVKRTCEVPGKGCNSVKVAWGGLALSTDNGLFFLTGENDKPVTVCNGKFSDSSFYDGQIFALEYAKGEIYCWMFENDAFRNTRNIILKEYTVSNKGNHLDTIYVNHPGIFIGKWDSNTITQHGDTGTVIATHGGLEQLCGPRLCGADTKGRLLVADCWRCKLTTLNPATGAFLDIKLNPPTQKIYFATFRQNTCFLLERSEESNYSISTYRCV